MKFDNDGSDELVKLVSWYLLAENSLAFVGNQLPYFLVRYVVSLQEVESDQREKHAIVELYDLFNRLGFPDVG